jgi:hypothetical protein
VSTARHDQGAAPPRYRLVVFAANGAPRPLLYLFGRGEDRRHQEAWRGTVAALVRHQRSAGPLVDALGCCKRQAPAEGGAAFVFGLYNAGHIWPRDGNRWLRAFFEGEAAAATAPR